VETAGVAQAAALELAGVAGGEQAEHAGEEVSQVRVGDQPGHGDVCGLDGEGGGQLGGPLAPSRPRTAEAGRGQFS
jgi:hypothetical protein